MIVEDRKRVFPFLVLLLGFCSLASAAVSTQEREALVALYTSTNGDSWTNNTNWLVGDPCTDGWYRVVCNAEGHVSELQLWGNNLVGTLPGQLGNLSAVQKLNFYSSLFAKNELSGAIPPELGNLTDLTYLNLEGNDLTGVIPSEIGNLSSLEYLYLRLNQLSGAIPPQMGNLGNLTYLNISKNQLTGAMPAELGNMASLQTFNLSENQLSGSIPPEFGGLSNLVELHLAYNQLSGEIPSGLGSLGNLVTLDLDENQLSGSIPSELGDLSTLQYLAVGWNRLSGSIPADLGSLGNLQTLVLGGNQLIGALPVEMKNLASLSGLSMRYNALYTDDGELDAFLDSVDYDGDWSATQTVAPSNVQVLAIGPSAATLGWDPIEYSGADRYRVWYGTAPGGPYTDAGAVPRYYTSLTVGGLAPETTYYFIVRTETDPHTYNQNALVSDPSAEVGAETTVTVDHTISIEKATDGVDADMAPGPTLIAGETVTWSYQVSNPSAVTLVDVSVNDTVQGEVYCPQSTLGPGASMTCTLTGTVVPGQYTNTGVATALPEGGGVPVGALDPSHYFAEIPDYCNVVAVSGVVDEGEALHEACAHLIVGPDYMAAQGGQSVFSSGLTVNLIPEVWIDKGAIIEFNVCGQSLCAVSDQPMPPGCHSCVVKICAVDPTCCDTWLGEHYHQGCVDMVASVCGLTCE